MARKRESTELQKYYDELLERQLLEQEGELPEEAEESLLQEEDPSDADPDADADELDMPDTEKILACTLSAMRSRDVVSCISEYTQLKNRYEPKLNPEYAKKYAGMNADQMLEHYLSPDIDAKEKAWLKEQIYLYIFFLLPHAVHKKYAMRSSLFQDAMQNLSLIVLQAMELYKPGYGWKFSDYLVGYFRSGIAKTFKDSTVVDTYSARKRAIEQLRKEQEKEAEKKRAAGEDVNCEAQESPEKLVGSDSFCTISIDSCDMKKSTDEGNLYDACKYSFLRNVETMISVGDVDAMDEAIHSQELMDWLEEGLSEEAGVLTRDEARTLILSYGLFGSREHTHSEIAALRRKEGLGYACSRISQIKCKATEKLQKFFRENGVLPGVEMA